MKSQDELLLNKITQVMIDAFRDEEEWSDYLEEILLLYREHSPKLYDKIIKVVN